MTTDKTAASRPSSHRGRYLILLIILVLGAGWLIYRHTHQTPAGGTAAAGGRRAGGPGSGPMPVTVVTAMTGSVPVSIDALGTVTPLATVTVRTQIAGQLTDVAFREGQQVKAGDFLAQVDPRPYQAQLEQAKGAVTRDQGLLTAARKELARDLTLVKQKAIAQTVVDTQQATVQQYVGSVQTDQAQVDAAQLNLSYCHITAPITGRIGLRQVDVGNYVQTGDANGIVVITQMDPISVLFSVPEDNLPAVTKRLNAGAQLPVTALDRGKTTTLGTGVLTTVDNVIDAATGTVKMRAQFANGTGALFVNQFVNIRMLVDTQANVVVLPASAIQRGQPGTFVYIVNPQDSTAHIARVQLGATAGDTVAVVAGVQPGQLVVSDGADKLKDGGKVLLPGAKTDTGKAGAGQAGGEGGHRGGHHRATDK